MKINMSPRVKEFVGTGFFTFAICSAMVDCANVGFQFHWHMMWIRIFYITTFIVFFYTWGKLSVEEQKERNTALDAARRKRHKEQFKKDYEKFRKEMHGS